MSHDQEIWSLRAAGMRVVEIAGCLNLPADEVDARLCVMVRAELAGVAVRVQHEEQAA